MAAEALPYRFQHGRPALSTWVTFPDPLAAEMLARQGWDVLVVDMQHGAVDRGTLPGVLRAIELADVPAIVRVPWNAPADVMGALDLGAAGVVCPMVDSVEDAQRFLSACLYPPRGRRSWGRIRGGGGDVMPVVQIETEGALAGLDRILSLDGLGAIYVGPNDLGAALGFPPGEPERPPELLHTLEAVAARARDKGVLAGVHSSDPVEARRMLALGYRWVTVASDASLLGRAARAAVRAVGSGQEG